MPIDRLIAGFKSFQETYYEEQPDFYRSLVEKGQRPDVMVIACSDNLEGEAQRRHVERKAVKVSLGNLLTFSWVKRRIEGGRLKLHGWWFDLEAGELLAHEAGDGWKTVTG